MLSAKSEKLEGAMNLKKFNLIFLKKIKFSEEFPTEKSLMKTIELFQFLKLKPLNLTSINGNLKTINLFWI